jgi:hypothetical protein
LHLLVFDQGSILVAFNNNNNNNKSTYKANDFSNFWQNKNDLIYVEVMYYGSLQNVNGRKT